MEEEPAALGARLVEALARIADLEAEVRRLEQDRADREHTLAQICAEIREIGDWVRTSGSEANLMYYFYRRWGITRPLPRRPPGPHEMEETKMQGIRLHDPVKLADVVPGVYASVGAVWLCRTPTGILFTLNPQHQVTEHEDGTITVAPSILATDPESGITWHGYLERGVWRAV